MDKVALAGIDALTSFTALGTDSILVRNYHVQYKKSGGRVPNVVLQPMGPNFTLNVRRHQLAAPDLWRTACKQPRGEGVKKKVKNESTNVFGDKLGRIHLGRQDLGAMKVKRMKALRKGKEEGEEGEDGGEEGGEEGGRRWRRAGRRNMMMRKETTGVTMTRFDNKGIKAKSPTFPPQNGIEAIKKE